MDCRRGRVRLENGMIEVTNCMVWGDGISRDMLKL